MRTLYYNWLLDELVTRFGEGAVDKVVGKHSTERFAVPLKPSQQMISDFGKDVATWLVNERGGQEIYIPSVSNVQIKRKKSSRNHDIRTSVEKIGVLAKKYDLTHRQIRNIRAQK